MVTAIDNLLGLLDTDIYRNLVFISFDSSIVSYSIPGALRSKQYDSKYWLVAGGDLHSPM